MLDVVELNTLFDALGIPEAGQRLVRRARAEAPVRQVRSNGGNVRGSYLSRKMGRDMEYESHRVEFPFAILLENDPAVLEYHLQPSKLDVSVRDADGHVTTRIRHIPDALVIRRDGIGLVEWKEETRLERLAKREPHRYQRTEDGWRSPPLEAALAEMGLSYRLRSSAELNHRYVENLLFLRDYYDPTLPPLSDEARARIKDLFAARASLFLIEALEPETGLSADDIYKALVDGELWVDFDRERLAEPKRCRLFRDRATRDFMVRLDQEAADSPLQLPQLSASLEVGAKVCFDQVEYRIDLAGAETLLLATADGASRTVSRATMEALYRQGSLDVIAGASAATGLIGVPDLARVHPSRLEAAVRRQDILDGVFGEEPGVTERTQRNWRRRLDEAPEGAYAPVLALVPQTHLRGNRTRRIPDEALALLHEVARREYFTGAQKNLNHCHKLFLHACAEAGLEKGVSLPTFSKEVHRLKDPANERARLGKRLVYQDSPFVFHLDYRTTVHGVRPWEYVHVDHTELDIELIDSKTGKNLGRPWLTLAIDAAVRRIVGIYLSFEAPSYRSVMMVMRDIVRRHGRLPGTFVLDNGPDFRCRDLKWQQKIYVFDIRYRPAGKPRHGSVMERTFGVTNQEFIHNLDGNTKITKHVRSVVKSVNPKNLAQWALEWLYFALEYWATELYDTDEHPALGMSPRQAYEDGMKTSGQRANRLVRYDKTFRIMTCPLAEGGTRVVSKARGVKLLHDHYWNEAFRQPSLWGKDVEVKIDPWDVRVCYAWIDGEWQTCISQHYSQLGLLSLTELKAYTAQARRAKSLPEKNMSARDLVEWAKAFDPNNFKDSLAMRMAAMRALNEGLGMGVITPQSQQNGGLAGNNSALPSHTPPSAEADGSPNSPEEDDDHDYDLF